METTLLWSFSENLGCTVDKLYVQGSFESHLASPILSLDYKGPVCFVLNACESPSGIVPENLCHVKLDLHLL